MSCKISVVIPVYKAEKYLDRCVESVVNQTYKNLEIILVDDGSPDNCPKMCDKWAKKDKRIKVIHKENGGVSSARNEGIKIATGDYITFCDADDELTEEFSEIHKFIEKDKDTEIFSVGLMKNSLKISQFQEKDLNPQIYQDLMFIVKNDVTICCVAKIIKREFLLKNDGFFPSGIKSEDFSWTYKLTLKSHKFKLIPLNYYIYNDNPNSATHKLSIKGLEDQLINYDRVYRFVKETNFTEKQKEKLLSYLMFPYLLSFRRINDFEKKDRIRVKTKILEYKHLLTKPHGLKATLYYILIRIYYF